MKIYIVLLLITCSLYARTKYWTVEMIQNNIKILNKTSMNIINSKQRSFGEFENYLIQQLRKQTDVREKTIKPTNGKLFDTIMIRTGSEGIRMIPELGYFVWRTEELNIKEQLNNVNKFTDLQFITMAQNFITDKKLVTLKDNEELSLFKIVHSYAATSKDKTEKIVTTTVIFGRKINGIFVIGAGSKIAISYNNLGELITLSINWKEISTEGNSFNLNTSAEIDNLLTVKLKGDVPETTDKLCGYYDGGDKIQSLDFIPLCSYFLTTKKIINSNIVEDGFVYNIPILKNHTHEYYK